LATRITGVTYALYRELVSIAREQYGVGSAEMAALHRTSRATAVGKQAQGFTRARLVKFVENNVSRPPTVENARFVLRLITNCEKAVTWRKANGFPMDRFLARLNGIRTSVTNINTCPEAGLVFEPSEAPKRYPRADIHPEDVPDLSKELLERIDQSVRERRRLSGRREPVIPADIEGAIFDLLTKCSAAYADWTQSSGVKTPQAWVVVEK